MISREKTISAIETPTYPATSRDGLAWESGLPSSSPIPEDDRDPLVNGLLGAELFSLVTVNSQGMGRDVLCSSCLLIRRVGIDTSDCFRS